MIVSKLCSSPAITGWINLVKASLLSKINLPKNGVFVLERVYCQIPLPCDPLIGWSRSLIEVDANLGLLIKVLNSSEGINWTSH
ncbi:Uncharacterised protein [Chlamydia trachomatis]|nr:Uncharacterised protein [Chlamydia trachomatis]